MKKILAYAIAFCCVFSGTAAMSSGHEEKAAAAAFLKNEEIIELSNGMTFGIRIKGATASETELTLISYTGAAGDVIVPLRIDDMTVTAIDDEAFKGNTYIRSVTLPDTINYFGESVFRDSGITTVNIPKKLRIIPDHTFEGCTALEDAELHDNLIVAGVTAFKGTGVDVPEELLYTNQYDTIDTSEDVLFERLGDWEIKLMHYGDEFTAKLNRYYGKSSDLILPDHFRGVPITDLDVTSIMRPWVNELNSIVIPATFSEMPYFVEHPELKKITFLGDRITIRGIGDNSIEELDLPFIDFMNSNAFENCKELRRVTFADSSEPFNIATKAFSNCHLLEEAVFPKSSETASIGKYAFENSSLKTLELHGDIMLNEFAFSGCSELSSVILDGDSDIGVYAFKDCQSLKNIVFGGSVKLDYNVFFGCQALENITLDTEKPIYGASFNNCPNLMNICSEPVFDPKTGDFREDIKDFVLDNFGDTDDVGFINLYVMSEVEKIVSEYTDDSMSDMQKIKALHDWVCDNTVYNHDDVNAPESHSDAALFMHEKAVCEGYAKALNLLLHAAGIETYYVYNSDHAWNVVKLGGHYFHVDTTWDDGDTISYKWFLKSDSELKAAGGFHKKWELYAPTSLHSFQGSVLPQCEYRMGDLDTNGVIDSGDLLLLQDYILGKAPLNADDIVLADLNHDGVTDVFDLICMRRLISEAE